MYMMLPTSKYLDSENSVGNLFYSDTHTSGAIYLP